MRIKASSLVEVTVSLVIMMMVFALSLMIYLNVTKTSISPKLQLKMFLQDYSLKTRRNLLFSDEKIEFGEYTIVREIRPYNGNINLLDCSYLAFDQSEKLLVKRRELIYVGK